MQAIKDEDVHLNVDLMHMFAYDPELYEQLVAYPGEVIPLLDVEAREIAEDLHGEPLPDNQLLTVQCLQCMHCILTLLCCAYKLSKPASMRYIHVNCVLCCFAYCYCW